MIVEPCCFIRQLDGMLRGKETTVNFFTNGDVPFASFLEYLIYAAPGGNVFLSLVRVEESTLREIVRLMKDIDQLTILSSGEDRALIRKYLHPFIGSKVTVCEDRISFRCVTVSNGCRSFVMHGSIMQSCSYSMQLFSVSSSPDTYNEIMTVFSSKKRMKSV